MCCFPVFFFFSLSRIVEGLVGHTGHIRLWFLPIFVVCFFCYVLFFFVLLELLRIGGATDTRLCGFFFIFSIFVLCVYVCVFFCIFCSVR